MLSRGIYTYFISRGQSGPGLVGAAVVVLGVCHLHVLVEAQDPPSDQFRHRGPHAKLDGGDGKELRIYVNWTKVRGLSTHH